MPDEAPQLRLILASSSPRRRELLSTLGLKFDVRTADIDERHRPPESPRAYVERLAREKAATIRAQFAPGSLVLAADTSVVLGEDLLGKPQAPEEARAMLRRLAGRSHRVLSGVALAGAREVSQVVETAVHFKPLSEEEIAWYVGTGEPMDKAGSYAIQGIGGAFVQRIEGSASNVIGLPMAETVQLLVEAGLPLPWSRR